MYYFTLFKASWCGHCQQFQQSSLPQIKDYINRHNNFVNLLIYDSDENEDIIRNQNIDGFPTIRLYSGTNKNPLEKEIIEFQNRDPEHIKRVLYGFEKKVGGSKKNKIESFKEVKPKIKTKSISYSSYYENYNGKERKEENQIICENGVCKKKNKLIDENGKTKEYNEVVPFNDYNDGLKTFYDVSLELNNHY